MLSYVTFLAGSLVVLLAVALIYKTISFVIKSASNSITAVSDIREPATIRNSPAVPQKKSTIGDTVHHSLIPLDRRKHETTRNRTKTHSVDPDPHRDQNYDWLLRERKTARVKGSYTVRRRFTPPPPTLESVSKPFRRERAPWVLKHEASKKR